MDLSKKAIRNVIVYTVLLFCVGFLNDISAEHHYGLPLFAMPLLTDTIYLHWFFSVRRRFPQKHMRMQITLLAAAFIALSLLKVAKYNFTQTDSTLQRYLWYAYYVPFLFGPVFIFSASLSFGKPNDYKPSRLWALLYIPAAALSAAILSNDLHRQAFAFSYGLSHWNGAYTHGPVYYLVVAWMALLIIGVIVMAVRSTVSRRLFRTAWLPLAVLAFAVLYWMQYQYFGSSSWFLQSVLNLTDFVCLCSILLFESLVSARIVVSNNDHPAIFAASSLNAGLADKDFCVQQASAAGVRPMPEQLRQAADGEAMLPDGNTLLKVRPVRGGWFYWTEDITELKHLQAELKDTADYLNEENAMLRVSAEIEEGRRRTAEQTKLYDRVTEAMRPQVDKLELLLRELPEDENAFRETMKKAAVLVAYLKRRSYLLLLAGTRQYLTGEELALCFEESAKALHTTGVVCDVGTEEGLFIPSGDADKLYEAFETLVERTFGSLLSIRFSLLRQNEESISSRLILESDKPLLTDGDLADLKPLFPDALFERIGTGARLSVSMTGAAKGGAGA